MAPNGSELSEFHFSSCAVPPEIYGILLNLLYYSNFSEKIETTVTHTVLKHSCIPALSSRCGVRLPWREGRKHDTIYDCNSGSFKLLKFRHTSQGTQY